MAAQDKFKSVSATFQIFKDGEAVSARKLDGIIRKTQEGAEDIEKSLGDMGNFGLAFSGLPLFHNSIARAIGPVDGVTITPLRVFNTPQILSSRSQGQIRYPYSTASASDAGNRSQNLLPMLSQSDKVGVGCVNDDGSACIARFDTIYNEEKNILTNGLFDAQLNIWEVSGAIFDGKFARMDTTHRYNTLAYSEDFLQWTNLSGTLTTRAFDSPAGGSNAHMFQPIDDGTNLINLELDGQVIGESSTDWCFSVWMATSGTQVTTFLEIDGATHVRGTQGRGAVNPAGDIYSVEVSGNTWERFYIYGTFPEARTSGVARIHLGRGNVVGVDDRLFIWGAQLEPTIYPSTYQATSGAQISGHVGETYIGQTFSVIPKKWYQISIDWAQISGTTWSLINQGSVIVSESSGTTIHQTFQAPKSADLGSVSARDINIHLHVSGSPVQTGPMKLKTFRVDPGTPCHALNCPGFSAYGKTRRYRATLPTITESNHQYFGTQLQFPDEVNLATSPELPGNILGVFDHEQNHAVPNRLVQWNLTNWPIGNPAPETLIDDPNFLTTWSGVVDDEWPQEFSEYIVSSGGTSNQKDIIIGASILSPDPSAPWVWLDGQWALSGYSVGADITSWADRSVNNRHMAFYDSSLNAPVVQLEANGNKTAEVLAATDYKIAQVGGAKTITGAWTVAIVCNYLGTGGSFNFFGNRVSTPFQNDGLSMNSGQGGAIRVHWSNSGAGLGVPVCSGLGAAALGLAADDTIVIILRRDASNEYFALIQGVDHSNGTVEANNLTFNALFTLDNDSISPTGSQIGEVILYESDIGEENALGLSNYLADKWGVPQAGTILAIDVLELTTSISGAVQGISKTFTLEPNEVYTWQYKVQGNLAHSGVYEEYIVNQGEAQLDLDNDFVYETIPPGITSGTINRYRVSGAVLPGETAWSQYEFGWWNITRKIKTTVPNTNITLTLGVESIGSGTTINVDSWEFSKVDAFSSFFNYSCDNILGLNWDGQANHVRDENLFQFSDRLLLWQSSGLISAIDADSDTSVRIQGALGTISQSISGADLLDETMTLTWQSQASNNTSGLVTLTQGAVIQTHTWTITTQTTSGIIFVSGINPETGSNLEVRWTLYGDEATLTEPQLVHGSGTVRYIGTLAEPVKKYRRVIAPTSPQTVNATWAPGYALVEGGIIQTTQNNTSIDSEGASWNVVNTRGFPDQGVIRIANQEYGYRVKTSGSFGDTLVGWRGTTFDPPAVASGSRITNVSIPQSITNINPTTKEITFRDIIPAPAGDWANSVNLQIYNTHISNLDRFSLQASAVSVTQATGNLLTAFVSHVSDHRRHFRLSQLCGQIIDSSSWCASPFIVALAELVDNTVEELSEEVQLNIEAKRFVPASNKEIIISWGDGQETTVTGVGTKFTRNTHIYDLKQIAKPQSYTIQVVVKDLDLDFSRRVTTQVIVSPKVNSAGQPTKSTIRASAKILLVGSSSMTASAKIKDQSTSTTTASANMVLP